MYACMNPRNRIAPARPPGRTKFGLDFEATTAECLRDLTRYFPPLPRALALLGPAESASTLTVELKVRRTGQSPSVRDALMRVMSSTSNPNHPTDHPV